MARDSSSLVMSLFPDGSGAIESGIDSLEFDRMIDFARAVYNHVDFCPETGEDHNWVPTALGAHGSGDVYLNHFVCVDCGRDLTISTE